MTNVTMNAGYTYIRRSQLGETVINAATGAVDLPSYIANHLIRLGMAA